MNRFLAIFQVTFLVIAFSSIPAYCQTIGEISLDPHHNLASRTVTTREVPAEWEPHEATWMQWPKIWESTYRETFSRIIDVLQDYEPVNIIVGSTSAQNQARNFLTNHGVPLTNITWHVMPYDWAWMRDNGPVWVSVFGSQRVQDWAFDGWGGLVPCWGLDDAVPCRVADIEGVACEEYALINERGNLEFNGNGELIATWAVFNDRNPGVSQAEMEELFRQAWGTTSVTWLLSYPPDDFTKGHVDGIARFINKDTVAVAYYADQGDPNAWIYEEAATIIQDAGFQVVRLDVPGYVTYRGIPMAANYMNWLVANGVVIVSGFGVPQWDDAAKSAIEGFFPGRDVVVVETLELWYWGGGVHCVTNDQPSPARR